MTKLKVIAGVFGLLALVGCATPNTAPEEAAPARQAQNLEIYAQPEETPVFYLSWCMDDSDSNTGNQAFPDTWQDVLAPAAVADALTFTSDDWQLMSTSLPSAVGRDARSASSTSRRRPRGRPTCSTRRASARRSRSCPGSGDGAGNRSGRRDLNPRRRAPKARAQPGCASPRRKLVLLAALRG